mmetsp:Transcript_10806/g.1632  ORF Transcript_10806/g.1632 Transcript_10806/m.1632 type:complete len:98 (+) Transcript_10806:295-588(+)
MRVILVVIMYNKSEDQFRFVLFHSNQSWRIFLFLDSLISSFVFKLNFIPAIKFCMDGAMSYDGVNDLADFVPRYAIFIFITVYLLHYYAELVFKIDL